LKERRTVAEGDIEKVTVAEQDAHQAVQFFSDYAAEESSRLKEQAEKEAGLLAAAYSPFRALIEGDPQAVSAFQELESVLKQEDLGSIPAQADDLFRYVSDPLIEALPAAAPGVQVFGPPYAFEWKKTGSSSPLPTPTRPTEPSQLRNWSAQPASVFRLRPLLGSP
jgi:flagellin-specific chaperone FliS